MEESSLPADGNNIRDQKNSSNNKEKKEQLGNKKEDICKSNNRFQVLVVKLKKAKPHWFDDNRFLVLFTFVLIIVVSTIFFLYSRKELGRDKTLNISQSSVQNTPTYLTENNKAPTETIPYETPTPLIEKDSIKRELQKSLGDSWNIELFDVSPVNNNAVAFTANENWSNYGIFIFDRTKNESSRAWYYDSFISGRGGYYADNLDLKFSPGGKAFYLNKTGTNLPSMFIISLAGKMIYESDKDGGHPTWLNDNELLFLSADYKNPVVITVDEGKIEISNLPNNIMHLKANNSGSFVLAYYRPSQDNVSTCNEYEMAIFNYPEGQLKVKVDNVTLESAKWIDSLTVSYKILENCIDDDFGYPYPTTSPEKTIKIE